MWGELYLIEILHQTTTKPVQQECFRRCILSKFYIKPQHVSKATHAWPCCILSKFYIKPQQRPPPVEVPAVVSYRNSTSNHNIRRITTWICVLYLIEILHQTTTSCKSSWIARGCILSKFYIKPQQQRSVKLSDGCCILSKFYIKPPRRKCYYVRRFCCILSKFYIKPQLRKFNERLRHSCILSKFYIKPQLIAWFADEVPGCILSKFYIKPQHGFRIAPARMRCILSKFYIKPQPPTINSIHHRVVSYRNSTSNHNTICWTPIRIRLYLIEILHQTTTTPVIETAEFELYLIEILHQTTTPISPYLKNS